MSSLGALSLLILLGTEYGVLSRSRALLRLRAPVSSRLIALRLLGWTAVWFVPLPEHGMAPTVAAWLVCIAVTESAAQLIHRRIRREAEEGRHSGSPISHLLPVAAGAAVGFGGFVATLATESAISFYPPICLLAPRVVEWAAAIVSLFTWSTLLTVSVVELARSPSTPRDRGAAAGSGELIGVLERLVVFLLVQGGALTAVGFVVAAKSAARFPQFRRRSFAEYFLIGTLCSVGIATLAGMAAG